MHNQQVPEISFLSCYCTRKVGSWRNKRRVLFGFLVLTITSKSNERRASTIYINIYMVVEKMPTEK